MKKHTLTIGIPAYNEERNIGKLLDSLLKQNQDNFVLEKIIVVSDLSTDATDRIVKEFEKEGFVQLINNNKRLGAALSQNVILKNFKSDILVLLDADVLPHDEHMLEELIKPLLNSGKVGLVSGKLIPVKPSTSVESVLYFSREVKSKIFESINNGNNIYLCHGAIRAFSKEFLLSLTWPETAGEDAYSYLACLSAGYDFEYAPSSRVYFKLPNNLFGYTKQSARFVSSIKLMNNYFDNKLVRTSYKLPISKILKVALPMAIKDPVKSISYVLFYIYSNVMSMVFDYSSAKWKITKSSKYVLNKVNIQ